MIQPWNEPLPDKIDRSGRRLAKYRKTDSRPAGKDKCPLCGNVVSVQEVYVERRYESENAPIYDTWIDSRVYECPTIDGSGKTSRSHYNYKVEVKDHKYERHA